MSDRNVSHLYPDFSAAYAKVLTDLQAYLGAHHPGYYCKLVEGLRTAAYQNELFQKRPRVTWKDGYQQKSNHQSGLAADVGIFNPQGEYIEEPDDLIMAYYGHCVRAHHLVWGGDWNSFVDKPHAEWPTADRQTYAAAGKWLKAHDLT